MTCQDLLVIVANVVTVRSCQTLAESPVGAFMANGRQSEVLAGIQAVAPALQPDFWINLGERKKKSRG